MDNLVNPFQSRRQNPPPHSPSTLIAFYDGSGKDDLGRSLQEILQWDANRLERTHNFIQTLFPLPEMSGVGHPLLLILYAGADLL